MSCHSLSTSWAPAAPARDSLALRLFRAVQKEIRVQRAMRQVSSLDERTLVDIGMMPGSTEDAVRRGRCR